METKEELDNINQMVFRFLAIDERCRNDDKWLTYKVFNEIAARHGQAMFIPFNLWSEFPAFETVKRVRANIQNKLKKFPPTREDVILKRSRRQRHFKQAFANEGLK
jgi:hypothetical protein